MDNKLPLISGVVAPYIFKGLIIALGLLAILTGLAFEHYSKNFPFEIGETETILFIVFLILVLTAIAMRLDIADRVYDYGDNLIIRKSNKETQIPLKDIKTIIYKPMYAKLEIKYETIIGKSIKFTLPIKNLFSETEPNVIKDLKQRIEKTRQKS